MSWHNEIQNSTRKRKSLGLSVLASTKILDWEYKGFVLISIAPECLWSSDKSISHIIHTIDRLSHRLIATQIELLLDYCLRFYELQFITRKPANRDILVRVETLFNDYFDSWHARSEEPSTVKRCASELCLSANHFGDLIKKPAKQHTNIYNLNW